MPKDQCQPLKLFKTDSVDNSTGPLLAPLAEFVVTLVRMGRQQLLMEAVGRRVHGPKQLFCGSQGGDPWP